MNGDMIVGVKRGPEDNRSATFTGGGSKKLKLETTPSRVVYLTNIPTETTELEIANIGQPFGVVTNVIVLRNQALMEMADVAAASNLVSRFSRQPLLLRGCSIYVQFSKHKDLKRYTPSTTLVRNTSNGAVADSGGVGKSSILRVIIDNMICTVTLDVLHQIFSRHGTVKRIVTFTKNSTFHALIEFRTEQEAVLSKIALDGQNIYNSCCTLRIDFSKMSSLNVKYNNSKSWDYFNPSLPCGDTGGLTSLSSQPSLMGAAGLLGSPFTVALNGQLNGAGSALTGLAGAMPLNLSGFSLPSNGQTQACQVLLVSNLEENKIKPDHLFTLFGVYGNVKRVKILYNKKDCALVQMAHAAQAVLAQTYLDKTRMFGKQLHIMFSKYQEVQMPRDEQPDAELTKDYSSSTLHRFRYTPSDFYPNAFPPSCVLHLSNLPPSATDETIVEEFKKHGYEVKAVKFFHRDRKMALIQLPFVDNAVDALVELHNFVLDGNNVKVSFSKSRL